MKINTRSITLAATMSALCVVTYMIPFVFFIPVTVAVTTLSFGLVVFVGLAFGLISLAYSFIFPTSLVATAFVQAPYIAIFPRVLAAMAGFGVYKLIIKFAKPTKKTGKSFAVAIAAAVASLVNTATVVGLFALVLPQLSYGEQTMIVYCAELIIRGAIECACMAVLTPPITLTLNKLFLRGKSKIWAERKSQNVVDVQNDEQSQNDEPVKAYDNNGVDPCEDFVPDTQTSNDGKTFESFD